MILGFGVSAMKRREFITLLGGELVRQFARQIGMATRKRNPL
jgi:hypothetical protein